MNNNILALDMSIVTFYGLSRSYQRKKAFFMTLSIWGGLIMCVDLLSNLLQNTPFMDEVAIMIFLGVFLHYILTGKFLFQVMAVKLFQFTPLGILYNQDKSIIDRTKAELLTVSSCLNFEDYLNYGKINPSIRSSESMQVLAQQKNGDLEGWVKKPGNLKKLANLVYQIYLVEQFLNEDLF